MPSTCLPTLGNCCIQPTTSQDVLIANKQYVLASLPATTSHIPTLYMPPSDNVYQVNQHFPAQQVRLCSSFSTHLAVFFSNQPVCLLIHPHPNYSNAPAKDILAQEIF